MWIERSSDLAAEFQQAANAPMGAKVWGLLSHVAFLAPLIYAAYKRHLLSVVVLILALPVSLAYHTCQLTETCFGFTVAQLQAADHLTAPLLVIAIASYFIGLQDERAASLSTEQYAQLEDKNYLDAREVPRNLPLPSTGQLNYARTVPLVQVAAVALAEMYYPYDLMPVYIAIVSSVVALALYQILFRVEDTTSPSDGRFTMLTAHFQPAFLIGGFAFLTLGVWFFFYEARSTLFHSFWHVWAAAAMFFFLLSLYGSHHTEHITVDTR